MTQQEKDAFFNRYKYAAIWEHIYSGVPASVTLAQAAIEGNYGTSTLFTVAKNSFGIKGYSNPKNYPLYYANDDAVHEPFIMYPTVRDSFADHSDFLQRYSRYDSLFLSSDPFVWADGLKAAGYATDPTYNTKLKQIIIDNDLRRFDVYGNNKYLIAFAGLIILALILFTIYKTYKYVSNRNK